MNPYSILGQALKAPLQSHMLWEGSLGVVPRYTSSRQEQRRWVTSGVNHTRGFHISLGGNFRLLAQELRLSTSGSTVHSRAAYCKHKGYTRMQFKSNDRPAIVVFIRNSPSWLTLRRRKSNMYLGQWTDHKGKRPSYTACLCVKPEGASVCRL